MVQLVDEVVGNAKLGKVGFVRHIGLQRTSAHVKHRKHEQDHATDTSPMKALV